jgi:hypothetical protein
VAVSSSAHLRSPVVFDTARWAGEGNEALPVMNSKGGMGGVAPYALDPDNADRLWDVPLRMLAR